MPKRGPQPGGHVIEGAYYTAEQLANPEIAARPAVKLALRVVALRQQQQRISARRREALNAAVDMILQQISDIPEFITALEGSGASKLLNALRIQWAALEATDAP